MKTKAYSYVRVSTPEQTKGLGIQRQIKLSEEYALKNNLTLDDSLKLCDLGLSGYKQHNVDRGALGRFIKCVEDGTVAKGSYLLIESLDRLSRADILDQLSLFLNIIRSGITIVTLGDDNRVYSKDSINNNGLELVISLAVMMRGNNESRAKSVRSLANWTVKHSSNKPMCRRGPLWLDFEEAPSKRVEDGKFVVNKERTNVVKKIYDLAANGYGQKKIVNILNDTTKPFPAIKKWSEAYVSLILTERRVLGEYEPCKMVNNKPVKTGVVIKDYYPPIISESIYNKVQNIRNNNKRYVGRPSKTTSNLFTHVAVCGKCGQPMYYHQVFNAKGDNWTYLWCSGAKMDRSCDERTWSYKKFESYFIDFISELDFSKLHPNTDSNNDVTNNLNESKGKLLTIDKQLNKLMDLISTSDDPPKTIVGKIKELETQKIDVEKQIQQLTEKFNEQLLTTLNQKHDENKLKEVVGLIADTTKRPLIAAEIRNKISRIDVYGSQRMFVVTFANGAQRVVIPEGSENKFYKLFNGGVIKINTDLETIELSYYTK